MSEMKGDNIMKAMYKIPSTETLQVEACALLQAISGPEGLKDGGQDDHSHGSSRAPQRPF
jgi:hypothetical protein